MTRLRAAALATAAFLTWAIAFDESNVVSLVAREALRLITRFLGLTE